MDPPSGSGRYKNISYHTENCFKPNILYTLYLSFSE